MNTAACMSAPDFCDGEVVVRKEMKLQHHKRRDAFSTRACDFNKTRDETVT